MVSWPVRTYNSALWSPSACGALWWQPEESHTVQRRMLASLPLSFLPHLLPIVHSGWQPPRRSTFFLPFPHPPALAQPAGPGKGNTWEAVLSPLCMSSVAWPSRPLTQRASPDQPHFPSLRHSLSAAECTSYTPSCVGLALSSLPLTYDALDTLELFLFHVPSLKTPFQKTDSSTQIRTEWGGPWFLLPLHCPLPSQPPSALYILVSTLTLVFVNKCLSSVSLSNFQLLLHGFPTERMRRLLSKLCSCTLLNNRKQTHSSQLHPPDSIICGEINIQHLHNYVIIIHSWATKPFCDCISFPDHLCVFPRMNNYQYFNLLGLPAPLTNVSPNCQPEL